MSWFGKITFGMIGLVLGGPLGAIAGLAIGHVMVDSMVGIPDQSYRDQSYQNESYQNRVISGSDVSGDSEAGIRTGGAGPGRLFHQPILNSG